MSAWYNENDPYCVRWLHTLRAAGHVPRGFVDERSIEEVEPSDPREVSHFFAGIGGWPLALRLAGWPEDRPVWTGSCPCQPFSTAGLRQGVGDPRHLWPEWLRLIAERRPPVIFGEQVASKDGRLWLLGVRTDLEALGYAVGAADLCAAGVGAPHIRQRLWWVAESQTQQRDGRRNARRERRELADDGTDGGVGDSDERHPPQHALLRKGQEGAAQAGRTGDAGGVGDTNRNGTQRTGAKECLVDATSEASFWSASDLVPCADGKSRRVEPGTFPLAHGVPARVGRLRAYGNAIVPQVAAEFVMAYMEATA